jgi:hypothetical protein
MNRDKVIGVLWSKLWAGLVALGMLALFIIIVSPVLSYIGTLLGVHSTIGGILSIGFLFGWLAALIIVPIYIATHLKYVPKGTSE